MSYALFCWEGVLDPSWTLLEDGEVWPTRGLVVRVIGRRPPAREIYGAEAVVLEVDQTTGSCRIKARVSGKSQVVPGVKMVDLETRVSRDCKEVRVVKGPKRGTDAILVKRDVERGIALVQIEGKDAELCLDSVCQFVA